jgi:hypothetical protein
VCVSVCVIVGVYVPHILRGRNHKIERKLDKFSTFYHSNTSTIKQTYRRLPAVLEYSFFVDSMILLAQKQEYRTNITTATAATTTTMDSPSRICSNSSSRRKRQLGEKLLPSTTNAYRLHYCCEHLGKYVGSTKRRITW